MPPYEGALSATKYGPACPQQTPSADSSPPTPDIAGSSLSPDQIDGVLKISRLQVTDVLESDEDCELNSSLPLILWLSLIYTLGLSINVIKPANSSTPVLLPVLVVCFLLFFLANSKLNCASPIVDLRR